MALSQDQLVALNSQIETLTQQKKLLTSSLVVLQDQISRLAVEMTHQQDKIQNIDASISSINSIISAG